MHDPVDQPSHEPSSDIHRAGGEPHTATQTLAVPSPAVPLLQLDQSPAIEPEAGLDHASGDHDATRQEDCDKPSLVIPTMWR
jgi:hypothetical protein